MADETNLQQSSQNRANFVSPGIASERNLAERLADTESDEKEGSDDKNVATEQPLISPENLYAHPQRLPASEDITKNPLAQTGLIAGVSLVFIVAGFLFWNGLGGDRQGTQQRREKQLAIDPKDEKIKELEQQLYEERASVALNKLRSPIQPDEGKKPPSKPKSEKPKEQQNASPPPPRVEEPPPPPPRVAPPPPPPRVEESPPPPPRVAPPPPPSRVAPPPPPPRVAPPPPPPRVEPSPPPPRVVPSPPPPRVEPSKPQEPKYDSEKEWLALAQLGRLSVEDKDKNSGETLAENTKEADANEGNMPESSVSEVSASGDGVFDSAASNKESKNQRSEVDKGFSPPKSNSAKSNNGNSGNRDSSWQRSAIASITIGGTESRIPPSARGEINNNTNNLSPGARGILELRTVTTADPNYSPPNAFLTEPGYRAVEVAIGSTAKGVVVEPMTWNQEAPRPTDGRFKVRLTEPLLGTDGSVVLPEGTDLITDVSYVADTGHVYQTVVAIAYPDGRQELVPSTGTEEGTGTPLTPLVIRGDDGEALIADAIEKSDRRRRIDLSAGLLKGALEASENVLQPSEQIEESRDFYGTERRRTQNVRNPGAAFARGFLENLNEQYSEQLQNAPDGKTTKLFQVDRGKEVRLFANGFITFYVPTAP